MGEESAPYFAFTSTIDALSYRLCNKVGVVSGGMTNRVLALWDTGATVTCISHTVVKTLMLVPTGKRLAKTPSGISIVDTYMVDVQLPNGLTIRDVAVCDSEIGTQGLGILIGMDIITLGDFAVSNYDGKTVFSFQYPSKGVTDYTEYTGE